MINTTPFRIFAVIVVGIAGVVAGLESKIIEAFLWVPILIFMGASFAADDVMSETLRILKSQDELIKELWSPNHDLP